MLCNEVTGARMEGPGQEGREYKVVETVHGTSLDEDEIEEDLNSDIDEMYFGEGYFVNEHWSESVEQDLKSAEECLPSKGVKEDGFEGGRKICIKAVHAEGFVVCQMVWLERY
jgi:hypothetical protein